LVGRVLDALDAQGLAEDTLVIYTSDHGFSLGDHYIFGLFHMLEESLKVPLIMAGPGVPENTRMETPVSHTDLYPTILEACDIPLNEDERKIGGQSLWPLIDGHGQAGKIIFAEYHGTATRSGGYVVRDGNYKLIHFVGLAPQLYDLSVDREEARNLAEEAQFAPVLAELMRKLNDIVDPVEVDKRAKDDQRKLIEAHGGDEQVMREMGGFSYSPPPGMSWKSMNQ
jgi:choline-sulfatase